jgi:mRNA-degrading endonuclease RelE of RelBE toxin-antitoxin system
MSFEVIPTFHFLKELKALAKKYPKIKKDIEELAKFLAENPFQGTPLPKSCYKLRIQITGKQSGKRGAGRVITYVAVVNEKAYLLSIYDKSEQSNNSELDRLLKDL